MRLLIIDLKLNEHFMRSISSNGGLRGVYIVKKKNQIYKNWFQELRIARLNSIKIEKGRCRIKHVK